MPNIEETLNNVKKVFFLTKLILTHQLQSIKSINIEDRNKMYKIKAGNYEKESITFISQQRSDIIS